MTWVRYLRFCLNRYNCMTFLMYADMCLAQPDCAAGEFKCVAGSGGCCISGDKICDGYLDCEDNVDEKNCPTDTPRRGE